MQKPNNLPSPSLVSDPVALRNIYRVLCGYCAYLLLEVVIADLAGLPQRIDALLRFIPYCVSILTLIYFARPLLKLNKQTLFMAVFLGCLFVMFLTEVTKHVPAWRETPVLGLNSVLRREIKDVAGIVAICSFFIVSYLMILETTRAKLRLDQEVEKLQSAERALQRSERRYRLISENTQDVIWTLDAASRRFTYVSPSVERMRGYTAKEAVAQPIEAALTLESHRLVTAVMAQHLAAFAAGDATARSWTGPVDQPCKDGSVVQTEVVATALLDEQGRVTEVLGVSRDVTERKRLEEQLRQAQKMEAVGQLAGGVAHDFNNLLTVIQGHCSLLLAGDQDKENSLESLKEIEAAAQRASNLTRQLLTFSRRQVMQMKPLDLNDVLGHLLKMLRRLLSEAIALEFQANHALPPIVADAGMIEQVVMNLSVNARDAMPKGGQLTLRTHLVDLDAQAAAANPEARPGRFVCLSVTDTGCGMDGSTRKRIFEPFFTTKEVGKGTGLGLATVYGIVKQHQGWTEVASEVGKGTTFRVFLPASPATAAKSLGTSTEPAMRGGTEGILVVEDDPPLRQLAKSCLDRNGYRVLEATNGVEAQAVWREHHHQIDLLLTDMVMPEGMTGWELAERLQAEKNSLKVIISSGYSLELFHAGAPSGRGIAYLAKPYEMTALAVAVRKCLDEA